MSAAKGISSEASSKAVTDSKSATDLESFPAGPRALSEWTLHKIISAEDYQRFKEEGRVPDQPADHEPHPAMAVAAGLEHGSKFDPAFIHCTLGAGMTLKKAIKFFAGQNDVVALTLDPVELAKVGFVLVMEKNPGGDTMYPHLYRENASLCIPAAAVKDVNILWKKWADRATGSN